MEELSQPKSTSVFKSDDENIFEKEGLNILNYLREEESLHFEKRLIDTDFFYKKGSNIGNSERYNRGKTIHTINVWWARRPLSTMRALIYASMQTKFTEKSLNLFNDLSGNIIIPEFYYKQIQSILRKTNDIPKLLDPFGGNGTIAFEGSNLGLRSYSMDINEYAYFIQKSLLNYGFDCSEKVTTSLLNKHGTNVLKKLERATIDIFPLRNKNFTNYLWSYQTTCTKCHGSYSLSKRKYLSKKKKLSNKNLLKVIQYTYDSNKENISVIEVEDKSLFKHNNWRKNTSLCPFCNNTNDVNFKNLEDKLIVGIKVKDSFGKEFKVNKGEFLPSVELLKEKIHSYIQEYNLRLPTSLIEKWSGIVNPGIYGMESHADIFNDRQKLIIIILICLLLDEYKELEQTTTPEIAIYIISLLTGLLDQLVDWNCRLSMWISENEQVGRAFCGPGIPMLWDYSEIDPVLHGPANLWDKLDRIIKSKKSFVKGSIKPTIVIGKAQDLPFGNNFFDLVVTDPPYYDNIYYSILSNFFYTWKKVLMEKIEPESFTNEVTSYQDELVSSTYRDFDPKSAHETYIKKFSLAISEIERVCKETGIFSLIYGHSSIDGWLPILESFKNSSLYITSVQPLRIERIHRPRSMKSNASNSVVVIVSRKFSKPKIEIQLSKVLKEINQICSLYIPPLQQDGWTTFEIGIPVFANCIGLLANHSAIVDENSEIIDLQSLLSKIIEQIQIFLPEFIIKSRKSL